MLDILKKFQETMTAAAFAEAGDYKTCEEIMSRRESNRKRVRQDVRAESPRPRPEMRAPSLDE
jgi:hypothetical protein